MKVDTYYIMIAYNVSISLMTSLKDQEYNLKYFYI